MRVTDVQVRLTDDPNSKLKAFCRVTIDDAIVVHDIKVIASASGTFIAMPSRRVMERCPRCGGKNHLTARFCNDCGAKLGFSPERKERSASRLHADIVHPINSDSRESLEQIILREFEKARRQAAEERGTEDQSPRPGFDEGDE